MLGTKALTAYREFLHGSYILFYCFRCDWTMWFWQKCPHHPRFWVPYFGKVHHRNTRKVK